jgi:hypothetical protein
MTPLLVSIYCVTFIIAVIKYLAEAGGRIYLTHCLRLPVACPHVCSIECRGGESVVEEASFPHGGEEAEGRKGTVGHIPSDLHLPCRSHPPISTTSPSSATSWELSAQHTSLCGHLLLKPSQTLSRVKHLLCKRLWNEVDELSTQKISRTIILTKDFDL